jgi:hypothetical protein
MSSRNRFTIGQVKYFVLNALLSLLLMLLLSEFNYSLWLISFSSVLSLSFYESLSHQKISGKQKVAIYVFTIGMISIVYLIGQKWINQLSPFWILYYFFQQFIGTVGGIFFAYLLNKSE